MLLLAKPPVFLTTFFPPSGPFKTSSWNVLSVDIEIILEGPEYLGWFAKRKRNMQAKI